MQYRYADAHPAAPLSAALAELMKTSFGARSKAEKKQRMRRRNESRKQHNGSQHIYTYLSKNLPLEFAQCTSLSGAEGLPEVHGTSTVGHAAA